MRYTILLAFLLTGCCTPRTVVIKDAPSVRTQPPDTVYVEGPPTLVTTPTQPSLIEVYTQEHEAAEQSITSVEVNHQTVTIRTRSGATVFRAPAFGETLVARADTMGFVGGVAGKPEERTIVVPERKTLFTSAREAFRAALWIIILGMAIAIVLAIRRFFQ
jgi:hypothetical protein